MTEQYMNKEYRQRRARDADPIFKLVADISFIVKETNNAKYFEKKVFNKSLNYNLNKHKFPDNVWMGNHHQAYACAYETYKEFKGATLYKQIRILSKLYN